MANTKPFPQDLEISFFFCNKHQKAKLVNNPPVFSSNIYTLGLCYFLAIWEQLQLMFPKHQGCEKSGQQTEPSKLLYFSSSCVASSSFFFLPLSPTKMLKKKRKYFLLFLSNKNAQKVNQLFNHAYQVMLVVLLVQKEYFKGKRRGLRVLITYSPCYPNKIKQE